ADLARRPGRSVGHRAHAACADRALTAAHRDAVMSATLPVVAVLPQLLDALEGRGAAVLVAPPGAGKTTRVPLALLDAPWLEGQRIIMLEPRRLAARNAATYMARLLGEP